MVEGGERPLGNPSETADNVKNVCLGSWVRNEPRYVAARCLNVISSSCCLNNCQTHNIICDEEHIPLIKLFHLAQNPKLESNCT